MVVSSQFVWAEIFLPYIGHPDYEFCTGEALFSPLMQLYRRVERQRKKEDEDNLPFAIFCAPFPPFPPGNLPTLACPSTSPVFGSSPPGSSPGTSSPRPASGRRGRRCGGGRRRGRRAAAGGRSSRG